MNSSLLTLLFFEQCSTSTANRHAHHTVRPCTFLTSTMAVYQVSPSVYAVSRVEQRRAGATNVMCIRLPSDRRRSLEGSDILSQTLHGIRQRTLPRIFTAVQFSIPDQPSRARMYICTRTILQTEHSPEYARVIVANKNVSSRFRDKSDFVVTGV